MPGVALSHSERLVIEVGIAAGRSNPMIAAELDRPACTIRREINRNGGRTKYAADKADRRAKRKRCRPKQSRLEADPDLAAYVAGRLQLLDSPMTISIELARGVHGREALISHECIYQAIYQRRGLDRDIRRCLHLRHRRRKHRNTNCGNAHTHSLGNYQPIADRPQIAADRCELGHLEGDLITGAYNRSALITLFDRTSRTLWLQATANKTAQAVLDAMVLLLNRVPSHLRRTLTWDQGSELAYWTELAERCGIDIYICDKNSPWQRPTNENGNGFVRRYVGKGTDLNAISQERLTWIEHRINTTPRRSLNWQTANDTYTHLSAPTL